MTNKINENVVMIILENVNRMKMYRLHNITELSFTQMFYAENIDDNFPKCNVVVKYWKEQDDYSIRIATRGQFELALYSRIGLTAIETVEILGKMLITDKINFLDKNHD